VCASAVLSVATSDSALDIWWNAEDGLFKQGVLQISALHSDEFVQWVLDEMERI